MKQHHLSDYFRGYRVQAVLAPVMKMTEAAFELWIPLIVKRMIDDGIGSGDISAIMYWGILMVGLGVTGLLVSVTAQYFSANASAGFAAKLRISLFEHIHREGVAEASGVGFPGLVARVTGDIQQIQTGLNLTLRLLMRSPVIVAGALIMSFTIDSQIAWMMTAVVALLTLVVAGIMLAGIPQLRRVQTGNEELLAVVRETLSGIRGIRAFGLDAGQREKAEKRTEKLRSLQMRAGRLMAALNPLTYAIVNGGLVLLVWQGSKGVSAGSIRIGAVVALVNYLSQILMELIKLTSLMISISKAMASLGRVKEVLGVQPDGHRTESCSEFRWDSSWQVRFDHVSFWYPGASEPALDGITFELGKGERLGIIGGTGSGKSTLVRLIPSLHTATAGQIFFGGTDLRQIPLKTLRNKIGFVPQKAMLLSGSLRENMKMGDNSISDAEVCDALGIAQAEQIVSKLPGGLDAQITQAGKNLSGGQRQRLTIARALARKPELLILDDSASALDYATGTALRKALNDMKPKPAMIVVSQRISALKDVDRILVLDEGKQVGLGNHQELMKSCPVYRELYLSQMPETGETEI